MKRFYERVTTASLDDGYAIFLDDRPIKTPKRETLVVPTEALALALAEEWDSQGKTVSIESMRLNKLANTAIDHIGRVRDEVIDDIAKYGETDLLCYRSDYPQELQDIQTSKWQPVLDWVEEATGARLKSTVGVIHLPQEETALSRIRSAVSGHDDFRLTALHMVTTLTGSVCLALALSNGFLSVDEIWDIATVDDQFQEKRWGTDPEAQESLHRRHRDLMVASRQLDLLKA